MRVLVYAASAFLISTGALAGHASASSAAFVASKPAVLPSSASRAMGKRTPKALSMQAPRPKHEGEAIACVDATLRLTPGGNGSESPAAVLNAPSGVMDNAVIHTTTSSSWTPPLGYMPRGKKTTAKEDAEVVFKRVVSLMNSHKTSASPCVAPTQHCSTAAEDMPVSRTSLTVSGGWSSHVAPFTSTRPAPKQQNMAPQQANQQDDAQAVLARVNAMMGSQTSTNFDTNAAAETSYKLPVGYKPRASAFSASMLPDCSAPKTSQPLQEMQAKVHTPETVAKYAPLHCAEKTTQPPESAADVLARMNSMMAAPTRSNASMTRGITSTVSSFIPPVGYEPRRVAMPLHVEEKGVNTQSAPLDSIQRGRSTQPPENAADVLARMNAMMAVLTPGDASMVRGITSTASPFIPPVGYEPRSVAMPLHVEEKGVNTKSAPLDSIERSRSTQLPESAADVLARMNSMMAALSPGDASMLRGITSTASPFILPVGYEPRKAHVARVAMPLHVEEKGENAGAANARATVKLLVQEKVQEKMEVNVEVGKTAQTQESRGSSYKPPAGYDPRARASHIAMLLHVAEKTQEAAATARVCMPLRVQDTPQHMVELATVAAQASRVSSYQPPVGYDPRVRVSRVAMPHVHVAKEEDVEMVAAEAQTKDAIDVIAAEVDAALKKLRKVLLCLKTICMYAHLHSCKCARCLYT